MSHRLAGRRVLVTQASDYMGPATLELFAAEGAELIADDSDLSQAGVAERVVADAGRVDVLIANLASPNFSGVPVTELDDASWQLCFDVMVHPLHRLCRAVLPQMIERRRGKTSCMAVRWRFVGSGRWRPTAPPARRRWAMSSRSVSRRLRTTSRSTGSVPSSVEKGKVA